MKRSLKIPAILFILLILCFTACNRSNDNSVSISDNTQSVHESSEKKSENSERNISQKENSSTNKEIQISVSSKVNEQTEISMESKEASSEESSEIREDKSNVEESSDEVVSENSDIQSSTEEVSEEPEKVFDESMVYESDKKYFVQELDEKLYKCFIKMYCSVMYFEDGVHFAEDISSESLDTMMFLLNYDCPELIQLNGDYSPIYVDEECKKVSGVYFTYNMSEESYNEYIDELKLFFETLKADIGEKSDIEKEKYVYDMIFEDIVYDDANSYSGTVWGTLINHIGRCEGICKSFMWCMRELDVECMCVSGTPKWQTDAVYAGHSWNIIKINGKYYNVDLTIDDIKENENQVCHPNYGFLNVNDEFNDKTHEVYGFYRELGLPECKSDKANYHKMNGLMVYSGEDVKEQLMEIFEKNFSDNKIDNLSIKFDNLSVMNKSCVHMEEWLKEFLRSENINYSNVCDEMCQTITVYVEVLGEEGEE